jgi:hypothetical protein
MDASGGNETPSLVAAPLAPAGIPDRERRTLAGDVQAIAHDLAVRARVYARTSRPTWPLADWAAAELELDARLEAGDPAALRDAVAEALVALATTADAIDATLARWTGPLVAPVASPGRLHELAARAAAGFELFTTTGP